VDDFIKTDANRMYQGWPNLGSRAACGSSSFPKNCIFISTCMKV